MVAIFTLLIVVSISMMLGRIATVALTFTGLAKDTSRFQARSAFTGAGFTTSESELIVQHPVRRRIIMTLMFLGNAGLVTVIATLMSGFVGIESSNSGPADLSGYSFTVVNADGDERSDFTIEIRSEEIEETETWQDVLFGRTRFQRIFSRMLALSLGLLLLWFIARSKFVDDLTFRVIGWALERYTSLESHDYHSILHLSEGFAVSEFEVDAAHWFTGKNLAELNVSREGIQVIGIMRSDKETYVGSPNGATYIRTGDKVILYGQSAHVNELKVRKADEEGLRAHKGRVEETEADRAEHPQDERTEKRATGGAH